MGRKNLAPLHKKKTKTPTCHFWFLFPEGKPHES
jgi:hypothetical protein